MKPAHQPLVRTTACLAALALQLGLAPVMNVCCAEEVDMVLRKSLTDDYASTRDQRRYRVLPGDTLTAILGKFGYPPETIPTALEVIRRRNPHIADADQLVPGQMLDIPFWRSNGRATAANGSLPGGLTFAPQPSESRAPAPAPQAPVSLMRGVFTKLGEKVQDRGTLHFPLPGAGVMTVDSARYPTVSLGNGVWLILDMEGTLPAAARQLIESTWSSYRLVSAVPGASPENALDEALRKSGFFSVNRDRKLTMGGEISVSLSCDWLVEKSQESIIDGKLYVLNFDHQPRETIPPSIRDFAARYNIQIVNILGSETPPTPPGPPPQSIAWRDRGELVDQLLRIVGRTADHDREIRLLGGTDVGLTLSFRADRWIQTPAGAVVVAFRDIAPAMRTMLIEAGTTPLVIVDATPPREVIAALFEALGLRFFGPHVEFFQAADSGKDKYMVNIPGFYVRSGGTNFLFTAVMPDTEILAFLAGQNVQVVVY